jgi:hypothetical protein
MSEPTDASPSGPPGQGAKKKGLPPSLIVLLCIIAAFCIAIFFFMRHGFYLFDTYKPDTSNLMPAAPGFP